MHEIHKFGRPRVVFHHVDTARGTNLEEKGAILTHQIAHGILQTVQGNILSLRSPEVEGKGTPEQIQALIEGKKQELEEAKRDVHKTNLRLPRELQERHVFENL